MSEITAANKRKADGAVACDHAVFIEALERPGIANAIYWHPPSAAVGHFGCLFVYPGAIPNDCIDVVGQPVALGRGCFDASALMSGNR